MLSKRSVDEAFVHYFPNVLSVSGAFASNTPTEAPPLDPAGGLPPPLSMPAVAHVFTIPLRIMAAAQVAAHRI